MTRHAFVYALLFFGASILLPEPGRAQNPPTASANLLEWSTPAAAGLDPDRIATIHAALQERVERGEVAGAVVLLARRGKVVYLDSVGYTDLSLRQPMRSDALFRIGSMTKPVTSVAVMILHDEGRISLSDPLSKYLPEFGNPKVLVVSPADSVVSVVAARREISIRDLLSHRSGLTYGFIDDGPVGNLYRQAGISDGIGPTDHDLAENVRRVAVQPLNFHPGESHAYGLSVDVLGRLVEVVSGQRLDVFFQERIFGPLGMKDTYFHVPDEQLSRLTTPYIWTRAAGLRRMEYAARDGNLLIGGEGYRGSNTYLSGGAGLISTARDYAQFLQMLLNSGELDGIRILRSETVELMQKSHTDDLSPSPLGAGAGMGLGLVVSTSEPPAGKPGSVGNYTQPGIYGTTFWVDPRQELIGIVLVQRYPIVSLTIDDLFQALTYQAIVH